jgi:hypothetical protein
MSENDKNETRFTNYRILLSQGIYSIFKEYGELEVSRITWALNRIPLESIDLISVPFKHNKTSELSKLLANIKSCLSEENPVALK